LQIPALAGGVPQTFAAPAPPQVLSAEQVPQLATLRAALQLSVPETAPQFLPSLTQNAASDSGAHPHTLGAPPPPQVLGAVHWPQSMVELQRSETSPQSFAWSRQLLDTHGLRPQTLAAPPPPQVFGVAHGPQSRIAPQVSGIVPQFFPWPAQVTGVQPPSAAAGS
jgi:hypothetical protein